jgi:hypothetical protein
MAANPMQGMYDKNGKFTLGGAYTHEPGHPLRRKVGYDEDDMKIGLSDQTRFVDDPRHMRDEDEYMSRHPIGNPSKVFHPGVVGSYDHLLNTHGGHRTALDVRGDIRHGLTILKGRPGGFTFPEAESLGYAARSHFYIQRQHEAEKNSPAGQRKAAMEAQASKKFDMWGQEESPKPAPAPAVVTSSKKTRTKTRLPNDTLRAGVTEMVKRVLPTRKK